MRVFTDQGPLRHTHVALRRGFTNALNWLNQADCPTHQSQAGRGKRLREPVSAFIVEDPIMNRRKFIAAGTAFTALASKPRAFAEWEPSQPLTRIRSSK